MIIASSFNILGTDTALYVAVEWCEGQPKKCLKGIETLNNQW